MTLFTVSNALLIGAVSALFLPPAHAGSSEAVMEASLHQYDAAAASTEWQNIWMPQASAHAVAVLRSGDLQMLEVIAGYTRSKLDMGGWENVLMTNSNYAAANPLLEVDIGSGATTTASKSKGIALQLPRAERGPA